MTDFTEGDGRWRTFVIAAVTMAYPLGQTGFELGAHGELSFENTLFAWTAVSATLVVLMVMPKRLLPVPRWHLGFLAVPSIWMLGRWAAGVAGPGALVHPALFALGIVSFALCFPYAVYLIVRIANPALAEIRGARLWATLVAVGAAFLVFGFFIGTRNELFVSCQEARMGRIELPQHCLSIAAPPDQTNQ